MPNIIPCQPAAIDHLSDEMASCENSRSAGRAATNHLAAGAQSLQSITPSFTTEITCSACRMFSSGFPGTATDLSDFLWLQTANTIGDPKQLCANRSSGLQRIDRFHADVHHLVELFGVAAMRIDRASVPRSMLTPFASAF
jgi:hypothetical protein